MLLKKRATTGSLSKNLFCQLQAKGKWLTILDSLKMKNEHGQRPQPLTKQTRFSYELKMIYIYIYGVHLGLLTQTFSGGYRLWVVSVSILISSNLVRLLPPCDFYLYLNLFNSRSLMPWFWCTCSIPRRICTQVPYSFFLFLSWGSVPVYSIPEGYVHKYGDDLEWKLTQGASQHAWGFTW